MNDSIAKHLSDTNFINSHYFKDASFPSDISETELRMRLTEKLSEYEASLIFVRHNVMEGYYYGR